ncbi:hypothetical protein I552_10198 [Mycobacterium xenopi 3993]|nr:hypothetical protein I552_9671 [Mycobacterium xenopi 3993]EUA31246.1 hypothetical protein I552_10198 [Mycobacterium xenopi 3993]
MLATPILGVNNLYLVPQPSTSVCTRVPMSKWVAGSRG